MLQKRLLFSPFHTILQFFWLHSHCLYCLHFEIGGNILFVSVLKWNNEYDWAPSYSVTHPSDRVDLTLPVRVTLGPWWPSGRSMDSELVCRLVMLWQLSVSLLPADELQAGQGRALEGRERPEAGLDAGESVHRSGGLPYSGLLPPLMPPALPRLPVPEEGESRLACLASVPWGLPSIEGHLPESGVPGELALLLALVPNNLGG